LYRITLVDFEFTNESQSRLRAAGIPAQRKAACRRLSTGVWRDAHGQLRSRMRLAILTSAFCGRNKRTESALPTAASNLEAKSLETMSIAKVGFLRKAGA
jgi:hypothetical protein